jgi:hypothetical protein
MTLERPHERHVANREYEEYYDEDDRSRHVQELPTRNRVDDKRQDRER